MHRPICIVLCYSKCCGTEAKFEQDSRHPQLLSSCTAHCTIAMRFFFLFFFSCLALHISIAPAPSVPTLVSACAGVEYAFSRSCLTFDIAIHAGRQKKHAPGEFQTNPIVEAVIDRVIMLSRSEGLDMRNLTRNSVPRRWLIIRLAQIRCILEALKTLRPRIDLCD